MQALIAQPGVETLCMRIPCWPAWLNMSHFDLPLYTPGKEVPIG